MKKIVFAVFAMLTFVVSVNATMITGSGYDINGTVEIGTGIEFNGIQHRIDFNFDENSLTLTNATGGNALWWVGFGKYTFSGFGNITDVYVESNNRFHGTTVHNFKWDSDSITLDMNLGWYNYSPKFDQQLVFHIDYTPTSEMTVAPVPEPSTMILFGAGIVSVAGMFRRRK